MASVSSGLGDGNVDVSLSTINISFFTQDEIDNSTNIAPGSVYVNLEDGDMYFVDQNNEARRIVNRGSGGGIVQGSVLRFSNLPTSGNTVNDLRYTRESQGTSWLPGPMGGTYYPAGLYRWDGSAWVSDRNAIAEAIQDLIDDQVDIQKSGTDVVTNAKDINFEDGFDVTASTVAGVADVNINADTDFFEFNSTELSIKDSSLGRDQLDFTNVGTNGQILSRAGDQFTWVNSSGSTTHANPNVRLSLTRTSRVFQTIPSTETLNVTVASGFTYVINSVTASAGAWTITVASDDQSASVRAPGSEVRSWTLTANITTTRTADNTTETSNHNIGYHIYEPIYTGVLTSDPTVYTTNATLGTNRGDLSNGAALTGTAAGTGYFVINIPNSYSSSPVFHVDGFQYVADETFTGTELTRTYTNYVFQFDSNIRVIVNKE